ncbi:MAG: TSUP family transporter [Alphaproteobacteria bacterium]|nr:TSUP family transporter [Alphaproteobacteria bacterium]
MTTIETGETMGDTPRNTIIFCSRQWKLPAAALAVLVALTFAWGFYLLATYDEHEVFSSADDLSVTDFLLRNVAMPDVQRLYHTVPPAVVGIGGAGVNAGTVASGAIIGANGYVITTLHSVQSLPAIQVQVATTVGLRQFPAQLVKTIPAHDLALLKLQTTEKFLYFKLADPQWATPGQQVFAFGRNASGTSVVRQGVVRTANVALDVGGMRITHLLRSDAVTGWEMNGGPLVNVNGELVGIDLVVSGPTGAIDGFTVPAQVVLSHFQDVLGFAQGAVAPMAPSGAATGVTVAGGGGAAGWWAQARSAVGNPVDGGAAALGLNVVQTAVPAPSPAGSAIFDRDHAGGLRIAGYALADALGLMMLALAAGITGGMMTMGGGVLQVAGMMMFFGYGMYLIRPVAFLTNVAVYGAASLRNDRAGLVQWDKVKALAPWAVAGVVLGYFIGNAVGDEAVAVLLGLFALAMALKALHEIAYPEAETDPLDKPTDDIEALMGEAEGRAAKPSVLPEGLARSAVLGLPMGLISGILGISGGVVEVPLQRYIGRIGLQHAIANSSVLVFWASVAGSVVSFVHGTQTGLIHWQAPVTLALLMIPGAYVGGLIGARMMGVLPIPVLKGIYAATMLAVAAKMLFAR